jgi:hypothetical protein
MSAVTAAFAESGHSEQAREILKREWEVTKQLRIPRLKDVRWRDD